MKLIQRQTYRSALSVTGAVCFSSVLAGCGVGGSNLAKTAATVTGAPAAAAISGTAFGGNQPVTGATVQIFVAGVTSPSATGVTPVVTAYGSGATALSTAVTTDGSGSFNIPAGNYTCPVPPAGQPAYQAYIVASGGNPGMSAGSTNPQLAMMAALGSCPAGGNLISTTPHIVINEVTTVAAVWALQQFMAPPSTNNFQIPNIGAPNTLYSAGTPTGSSKAGVSVESAAIGLANAFTTARVMADTNTGASPNANYAYSTPESAKIFTVADILAYCINSAASVTGTGTTPSSACTGLFNAATPTGATPALDTIQAAYYMAQNPINNLPTLYGLISAGAPFQPTYSAPQTLNSTNSAPATSAFNDTTIAINYAPTTTAAGTALSVGAPFGIAIDAYGNAWVTNGGGVGSVAASVAELGVDGSTLLAPATTFTASTTAGSAPQFTTPPAAAHTVTTPKAVAIDLLNNAWFVNQDALSGTSAATSAAATTGSVGIFTGSTAAGANFTGGSTAAGTGYLVGATPYAVAIDGANNVFVSNTATASTSVIDGRSVAELVGTTGAYTYSTSTTATAPYSNPGSADFLAIDTNTAGQNVWLLSNSTCKVTGQANTTTTFGAISQYADATLLPDSNSELVSSYSNATVGAGSSSGSCGTTSVYIGQLLTAAVANPFGLAIDRNNGAWLTDAYTSSNGFDGLTYVAAPTTSAGGAASSTTLVNGVLFTSTAGATPGTTLTKAGGVAVDGNNNAWIGNQTAKSVVEASYSTATGSGAITLLTPGQGGNYGSTGAAYGIGFAHNTASSLGVAIDPSGNVWVANNTTGTSTYTNQASGTTNVGNSVTVIVGAAGPVVTPLSLALKNTRLGTKP